MIESNLLPNGWTITRLDDITNNFDGKRIPIKSKNRETIDGEYPYYGASGIIDYINDYIFDGEFLLIGEDGANLIARSKPIAFKAKGKFWVNNHAHVLQTLKGIPLTYLEHYINSIDLRFYVTGSAQPKLTQLAMNKILVPLSPLNEQKRIVSKIEQLFTKLDAGIEYLKKTETLLKEYRQSVLKYAFEGKLTEEWRESNLKDNINNSITERENSNFEDLWILPKTWKWVELKEVAEFKNGINFKGNQKGEKGIPTIDVLNMYSKGNSVDLTNIYRVNIKVNKDYILEDGDILFVRSSVKRGGVGWATTFRESDEPITYCGFIIRARLKNSNISSDYLVHYLRSNFARSMIINSSSQVTITNINQQALGKILFPMPLLEEQKKIAETIEHIFVVIERIQNVVKTIVLQAKNLRNNILKNAFEGKLVTQNPSDEPAEILLHKIKQERELTIPIIKDNSKITKKKSIVKDSKQMRLM